MRVSRVILTLASVILAAAQVFGGQKPVNFSKAVDYSSAAAGANAVVSVDVNGDGYPDIVVATNEGVTVLLNDGLGDGLFLTPGETFSTAGNFSEALAVLDVNGDGIPDIVITNMCLGGAPPNCQGVAVLLGNGDGTFQSAVGYNSGGLATGGLAVGDVNGDGYPDIVVVNNCQPQTCVTGTQTLLLNNYKGVPGTFGPPTALDDATGPVALGALTNSGFLDLVTGAGVMLGNGDGTFQPPNSQVVGGAISITLADVNNDGKLDVVSALPTEVAVQLGNGDGTLQPAKNFKSGGTNPLSVAITDFNGDNNPDLAVINECSTLSGGKCSGAPKVGVLAGNGDGTFKTAVTFDTGGYLGTSVAAADVNQDGKPDLVAATACTTSGNCTGSLGVLLNDFMASTSITLTSSLNPAILGQSVTFTATITSVSPVPDGSQISFTDNGTPIGSSPTTGGVATLTWSFSTTKHHSIVASYGGDLYHNPSSKTLYETVNPYLSTTTVTTSPNPSTSGQSVTITATVTSPEVGGPTGEVDFYNGGSFLGKGTLSGGVATFTTSKLPVGTLTINADYKGDTNSAPSSGSTTQTVN